MSKWTPKNHKNSHNTPVVLCRHEKKFESNKRKWISFRPQWWDVPYRKPSCLLWEALVLWEAYTQTCPKWDKIFTTACWCRSMIACQVSWISDKFWIYHNFKTRHLNVLPAINGALVFEIHSHFCMVPKHAPKDTDLSFNQSICAGACACSSNLNYAHKMH